MPKLKNSRWRMRVLGHAVSQTRAAIASASASETPSASTPRSAPRAAPPSGGRDAWECRGGSPPASCSMAASAISGTAPSVLQTM